MYCSTCGTNNPDGSKFCSGCGNNLQNDLQVQDSGYIGAQEQIRYEPVNFKVQQKFFALRPTYKITDQNGVEFMVVKRNFINFFRPYLFVENSAKERIGSIQGNFWRTNWEIRDNQGNLHATITFPFFMIFRKNFQIITSNGLYRSGDSIFTYRFDTYSPSGQMAFTVDKKILSIRDSFQIQSSGELSPFITCLAAVCIDQKFHSGGGSSSRRGLSMLG